MLQAVCMEGTPMIRASRTIPNYLIRLLPPLAVHNRLPYAVEIRVPTIKYEVRIEPGEKTNIYFLNLLKMHRICIEVITAKILHVINWKIFSYFTFIITIYSIFKKKYFLLIKLYLPDYKI